MNRDKEILRCDFYLRTKYPHLNTRIFKLKNGFYAIYADNYPKPFSSFEDKFHNQIKPICTPILVTETIPSQFDKELSPYADTEIASTYAGMPLTVWQLQRLVQYNFPDIDIVLVDQDNQSRQLLFYVRMIQNDEERKKIENFITSLELKMSFRIIEDDNEIKSALSKEKEIKEDIKSFLQKNPNLPNVDEQISNHVFNMLPIRQQTWHIKAEERDEELFFERLECIYKGTINKTDIAGINDNSLNCYIDYSMLDCSNINIRNGILLYDKVFIDLPLMKSIEDFCNEQKVRKDELLELCNKGKINFILTHPSVQYDKDFLENLYDSVPNSIITRRTLSSLIIADLVEINKNYFINTVDGILANSLDLSKELADRFKKPVDEIYRFLTWPQTALRKSFEVLLFDSPTRLPLFGINNTFPDFKNFVTKEKASTIEFELLMNTDKVHIASALNSIYFPYHEKNGTYTNKSSTSLMADRLNFYKNASIEKSLEYSQCRNSILKGNQNITPIDLIDINEYIPIDELNKISDLYYSSSQFNSIFSFLAHQSEQERIKTIRNYNELIEKEINKKGRKKLGADFAINGALDGIGVLLSVLNIAFPVIGLATTGIKLGLEKIGINDKVVKKWEKSNSITKDGIYDEKRAISFLAKINPVARLNVYN